MLPHSGCLHFHVCPVFSTRVFVNNEGTGFFKQLEIYLQKYDYFEIQEDFSLLTKLAHTIYDLSVILLFNICSTFSQENPV